MPRSACRILNRDRRVGSTICSVTCVRGSETDVVVFVVVGPFRSGVDAELVTGAENGAGRLDAAIRCQQFIVEIALVDLCEANEYRLEFTPAMSNRDDLFFPQCGQADRLNARILARR